MSDQEVIICFFVIRNFWREADCFFISCYRVDEQIVLFIKSGELPIYLLDQKTGEKSNAVKFIVK